MEAGGPILVRLIPEQNKVEFYYNNRKQAEYTLEKENIKNMKQIKAYAVVAGEGAIVEFV